MIFNIITFHDALNHGAVLQAYALQQFIEDLGYETGIFDYRSPGTKNLKGQLIRISRRMYRNAYMEKERRFREFASEKLKLNLEKQVPVFLTGSDQVWNPTGRMDPAYFLSFVPQDSIKASYAASLGVQNIPEERREEFARLLKHFDAVSVRETSVKEEIRGLYDGHIEVHADPVLLFDRDFWIREARKVEGLPEDYIFVYALQPVKALNRLIRWLQTETGAKVVLIDEQGFIAWQVRHDIVKRNLGPREFLWLIAHARAVISTSFHGAAFALIFHKELYPVMDPQKPSRIANLMEMFGIPGVQKTAVHFHRADTTDWEEVDRRLLLERERSRNYFECLYLKTQLSSERKAHIGQVSQDCTGCGCCVAACPVQAISMERHPEGGFLYPKVKETLCTGCGACMDVCPVREEKPPDHPVLAAACAWHHDPRALIRSTSGGVFRALAELVLSEGGVVFGVKYTEGYQGTVYTSSDESRLEEMQGSKYIAPDPAGVAEKVKDALSRKRLVLFSGAPCHVSGILNLAGRQEHLITCDFICRGMPSPDAYQAHLKAMERKAKSQIRKVEFRSKIDGWNRSKVRYHFGSGKTINVRKGFRDSFYRSFAITHVNVRECCTDCHFSEAHAADITMGDYWNYRCSNIPKNHDGMSIVLANTEQGRMLLEKLKQRMAVHPLPEKEAAAVLQKAAAPERNRRERNSYFSIAQRIGYEAAAGSFGSPGYIPNLLSKLQSAGRRFPCQNSAARRS